MNILIACLSPPWTLILMTSFFYIKSGERQSNPLFEQLVGYGVPVETNLLKIHAKILVN